MVMYGKEKDGDKDGESLVTQLTARTDHCRTHDGPWFHYLL